MAMRRKKKRRKKGEMVKKNKIDRERLRQSAWIC